MCRANGVLREQAGHGQSVGGESPEIVGQSVGGESPEIVGQSVGGESSEIVEQSVGGESPEIVEQSVGGESPEIVELCGRDIATELGDGQEFAIEPSTANIDYNENEDYIWIALTFTEVLKFQGGGQSPTVRFRNIDGHITLLYAPATCRDALLCVASICSDQAQRMGIRRYVQHLHGKAYFEERMAPGRHYAWCDLLVTSRLYNTCCTIAEGLRTELKGKWCSKYNFHTSFRTSSGATRELISRT